jgi:protein TonB
VKLEFSVSEHGEVENVRVIESTSEVFEQPSVAALQQWRYVPRLINGLPIQVDGIQTTLLFKLAGAGRVRSRSACQVDEPLDP